MGAPKFIRQIFIGIKNENDGNAIIIKDCNIHLQQWIDHPGRKSIWKLSLNVTLDQLDIADTYKIFHPKRTGYTLFFRCTWKILQNRSHVRQKNKSQ